MKRVLVVDDSAVIRERFRELLAGSDEFVVDVAADGVFALAHMERRWPDVLVVDLEMPRMDGFSLLSRVMKERPTPAVVCSSLTEKGAEATVRALAAGAVSVFPKHQLRAKDGSSSAEGDFLRMVREASMSQVAGCAQALPPPSKPAAPGAELRPAVIAIGSSTGGPQTVERLLVGLPETTPGIVITQHMPSPFTSAFAQRLDTLCALTVKEAQGGELVAPGLVFIAPGGRHLVLRREPRGLVTQVLDAPPVNRHRPSVDVLFRSVARLGADVVAMLLTGMGDDGARGLLELRQAGARTFAQSEASCVVYGMPKEAVALGAASQTSLEELRSVLLRCRASPPS
ncbi:MAG: chemotaxis response regulator protein-glutamate methylesterase [Archangium sp.]|nr:chemotaxis response regulator protein-glutamate methylesterase [Archangium sp.]